MPYYRRRRAPGGTYFFTVVTENRAPILCGDLARNLLHNAIRAAQATRPFTLAAMVLLPDHLLAMWELPDGDDNYSTRWSAIKAVFTRDWLAAGGAEASRSQSRLAHRNRGVWQRRFWEHEIRDADDFERHLHYIHYNPVKHELATCPHQWQWSTFQRWINQDAYGSTWCCACDGRNVQPPSFEGMDGLELE
jgi:putative transposase